MWRGRNPTDMNPPDDLAVSMDESAFVSKKRASFAPVLGLLMLIAVTFGGLAWLVPIMSGVTWGALLALVLIVVSMMYAGFDMVFSYLRVARPFVSHEGIVPWKWTVHDVVHRRRIVLWSEVLEVKVERDPGGAWWWVTFSLRDGSRRYVRSDRGVPDQYVAACEQFARLRGIPILQEMG